MASEPLNQRIRSVQIDVAGSGTWADGSFEHVDVIILATGFLPDVSFLPVAALDSSGIPLHTRGASTAVPGLGYVGLERQRMFASATLRGVGPDARHILNALGASRAGGRAEAMSCLLQDPAA